jgi:uncharacterized protein (DUF1499 family)
MKYAIIVAMVLVATISLVSCSGKRPSNLGIANDALTPCPPSPNCVSSDADDNEHRVAPLQLAVAANEAWPEVRGVISELPRTHIVTETENYIHAECQSAVFGFVDDLELHLRATQNLIAVRSASRLGYSDFGVNRNRIESLRASLIKREVVK